jgi:DHA2 family multidrug resistance protein
MLRGIGLGFIFVPLNTLALGGLVGPQIAQGAGITAMIRQLGGAFGVAILSTYLTTDAAGHRNDLLRYLGTGDPAVNDRITFLRNGFLAKGSTYEQATTQAYRALEGIVQRQTALLTYMDVFLLLGAFFLLSMPLVIMFKRTKQKVSLSDAAH